MTPEQETALRKYANDNNIGMAACVRFALAQLIDDFPENMPRCGEYKRKNESE